MRRVTWLAGLAGTGLLLLGAVYGCSSSTNAPPVLNGTGSSGGGSSGGGSGSGSGGGSGSSSGGGPMCLGVDGGCTDLQLCGPKVTDQQVTTGTMPTPQGGTVAPGTYELTSVDIYPPPAGTGWLRQTMRFTAMGGPDGGASEAGSDASPMDAASMDDGSGDGASSLDGGGKAGPADAGSMVDASDSGSAGQTLGLEVITLSDISPTTPDTVSGTIFNLDATHLAFVHGCPSNTSSPFGYTTTATTLVLISPGEVLTYTKQ